VLNTPAVGSALPAGAAAGALPAALEATPAAFKPATDNMWSLGRATARRLAPSGSRPPLPFSLPAADRVPPLALATSSGGARRSDPGSSAAASVPRMPAFHPSLTGYGVVAVLLSRSDCTSHRARSQQALLRAAQLLPQPVTGDGVPAFAPLPPAAVGAATEADEDERSSNGFFAALAGLLAARRGVLPIDVGR